MESKENIEQGSTIYDFRSPKSEINITHHAFGMSHEVGPLHLEFALFLYPTNTKIPHGYPSVTRHAFGMSHEVGPLHLEFALFLYPTNTKIPHGYPSVTHHAFSMSHEIVALNSIFKKRSYF